MTHHKEHYLDDAEIFKRQALKAKRIKKFLKQAIFYFLSMLAVLVTLVAVWVSTH